MDDRILFFLSCFAFAFVPGPAMLYTVSKTLAEGRCSGFCVVTGIFLGSQMHVVVASAGAATLLVAHPDLFLLLRYIGGCYFLYLGGQKLYQAMHAPIISSDKIVPRSSSLKESFVVELLNPKSSLFYLAFIPQFLSAESQHPVLMLFLIGTLANAIMSLGDFIIVVVASLMRVNIFGLKTCGLQGAWLTAMIYFILGGVALLYP